MAETNFRNRTLYHGDNLDFLRGMNSETVDLVATDPPFKKGRDFHATPDSLARGARFTDRWSWDKDVHPDWMDAMKDDWPTAHAVIELARTAYGDDMGAYLCWLGVRLMECHRILKPTGSLYLHIDHTAHAYVKTLLDAIFGKQNFRNEIVWRIGWVSGFKTQKRGWIRNHDTLLYYVRSPQASKSFNKEYIPYPQGYVRRDGKKPTGKGIPMEDTWNCSRADILDSIMIKSFSTEKVGYPTQKPLALYERIIKASSDEGDIVLDPFAGCATTPVAAERLGRQWVAMDIWDGALEVVKQRMEDSRQLLADPDPEIFYSTAPPVRTDNGEGAAPALKLKVQVPEPPGPKMTHAEMKAHLIGNHGLVCRGCLRTFDDERYLQLDHNTPRSDGGLNHVSNRLLLCGPCNLAKSNTLTLTGLRRLNKQNGWMAKE